MFTNYWKILQMHISRVLNQFSNTIYIISYNFFYYSFFSDYFEFITKQELVQYIIMKNLT